MLDKNNNLSTKKTDINHQIGHRKRLKSKMLSGKNNALLDYEILELILYSSHHRIDVKPIAKKLIHYFGSFSKVFNARIDELKNIQGVTDSTISAIFCVKEALDRILREEIKEAPIINSWKKLIEYLKVSIGHNSIENFRILYLNKKHYLIADDLQDVGTVDQTPLYVREIIKRALALGASSIIISHNHPSGDAKPSNADLALTQQLLKACCSMNIVLLDHIIITAKDYYSFKTHGLL